MRLLIFLVGLAAAAMALFFAWRDSAAAPATFAMGALAVACFVAFRLSAPPAPAPSSTASDVPNRARLAAAAELAGALEVLAEAREEGHAGPATGPAVYLLSTGRNQIAVIKAIRQATGLGLKEAKDLSDQAKGPGRVLIARGLDPAASRRFLDEIQKAGGEAISE